MSLWSLDNRIDESTLSHRNRTVLKAFAKRVNRPTRARPEPDNYIIWPSLEDLQDLTRYSVDTLRCAKRELIRAGILQPVEKEGAWRHHTPRYRIDPERLVQDDAAIARQEARRQRRHVTAMPRLEAAEACPGGEQKGMENPHPSAEKGMENPHPLAEKGYGFSPPELTSSTNSPENPNFFGAAPEPMTPEKKLRPRCHVTPTTKTPAPDHLPLDADDDTWIEVELPGFTQVTGLTPQQAVTEWLDDCRAQHYVFLDWPLMMRSRLRKRYNGELNRDIRSRPTPVVERLWNQPRSDILAPSPATPTRTTCSRYDCSQPPCAHNQACAYHAGCEACRAEPAPEGNPAPTVSADTRAAPLADSPPEVEAAEVAPPAEVQALLQGFLQGHTMPATSPPPAPLGSLPRQKSALTRWRERWRADDQPTYTTLIASRQAREAQDQPAMAAD